MLLAEARATGTRAPTWPIIDGMGDWLTLLFLVPAILVPVVVLMSFAGCDRCWGLVHVPPAKPIIDEARGIDAFTIHLAWHFPSAAEKFHFERTGPDGNVEFDALVVPHDDTGLDPNTTYDYQVQAVYSDGDTSEFSTIVPGTTRPFVSAYSRPLTQSTGFVEGGTLIQRIEASHLSATGSYVRITVQAAPESDAWIDRVYISKASMTGNEWDPDTDKTKVYDASPFVVTKGTKQELPITKYTIDQSQALLIAIDFTPGPASGVPTGPTSRVGSAPGIPRSEATAYFLQPAAEAASPIRSANYNTVVEDPTNPITSYVICVIDIEVDPIS